MSKKKDVKAKKDLYKDVKTAAAGLVKIQKKMEKAGVFSNDREILQCNKCGLKEDLTFEGMLITYFGEFDDDDTGMRFKKSKDGKCYICPNCDNKLKA